MKLFLSLMFCVVMIFLSLPSTEGAKPGRCQRQVDRINKETNGMPPPGKFVPQCDANGNYNPIQYNGSTGFAKCVDIYTGKTTVEQQNRGDPLPCDPPKK